MKYIIKNKSKLGPQYSLLRVNSVMDKGKISKHSGTYGYCFVSTFDDCYVNVELTRCGTHVFTVSDL